MSYQIKVTPAATSGIYDVAVYVFTQCSSVLNSCLGGADNASAGKAETVMVKAKTSGPHIIGVDSYSFGQWGKVTVSVTSAQPPGNDTCAKAQALVWSGGMSSVTGSNLLATNSVKLSSLMSCTSHPLGGGDLFYSVALLGGETYKVTATPGKGFDVALWVVSGCGNAATSCLQGADANLAGGAEKILFTPKASGTFIIGLGTRYSAGATSSQGNFTLEVAKAPTPGNDSCAKATPLVLAGGVAQAAGDTTQASDTIKLTSSGCTAFGSPGPDLFYSVSLDGGKTYTVILSPEPGFDSMLYAFTSCGAAQKSCVAGRDNPGGGKGEILKLSPKVTTTYTVAVDSYHSQQSGKFALTVK